MKTIIKNKLYDTETAKLLGDYSNGDYTTDFEYYCEELYRKKNGEFFLYGHGGCRSPYAEKSGNNIKSGEQIIPFSDDEAKKWAEKHLDADTYIDIFGIVEE